MMGIVAGFLIGVTASLAKVRLNKAVFAMLGAKLLRWGKLNLNGVFAALYNIASNVITFAVLFVCIRSNLWLFGSCAAGMLTVPLFMAVRTVFKKNPE
ncbi:MAG: hypothetical protein LBC53_01270 [Spirochaetaceae bacterium]|jgi:hypothetical protein|nr:hypothetical protein [Spirochaetaceae bacterium]